MAASLVVLTVILSIVYGYKTQKNIGPAAASFAFLIGCGILGMNPRELIDALPMQVMVNILAVTFFFGFAIENGTMTAITHWFLYSMRKHPHLMAIALFLICYLVALSGAGIAASAFLAPIAFSLAAQLSLSPLLAYTAVACGTVAGSNFMFSSGGIVILGMIEGTAEYADQAFRISVLSFRLSSLLCTLFFLAVYLATKSWRCTVQMRELPERLNVRQKLTLGLILAVALVVIVPKIASELFPSSLLRAAARQMDASLVMLTGAALASLFNLADEKTVIRKRIPWGTILMLGGVSLLIAVGREAGLAEMLPPLIAGALPRYAVIPALGLAGGLMSIFSSAISVVLPTLYPLVPGIAADTGLSAPLMYSAIFVGATMTGISTLSTTGSMVLVGCRGEEARNNLFYQAFALPFIMAGAVTVTFLLAQFL